MTTGWSADTAGTAVASEADATLPALGAEDLQTLRQAVQRLRQENAHLRQGLRSRVVVEQAKGVLMAREGVDAEAAFALLRRAARDGNRRLVEVAADELAAVGEGRVRLETATPPAALRTDPPPEAVGDDEPVPPPTGAVPQPPSRVEHDRGLVLLRSAVAASDTAEQALAALAAACRWPAPAERATLLQVSADGGLDLVASVGIPTAVASRWQHVPMTVDFPATHTARTGEPVFADEPDEAIRRWPVLAQARASMGSFCDLPLLCDGVVVGVLGLGWPEGTTLSGRDRKLLRASAVQVTDVLLGSLREGVHSLMAGSDATAAERVTVGVALDAVPAESVLLLPVAPRGRDLLLAWGNARARRAAAGCAAGRGHPFGQRASEVVPHLVGTGLWRDLHTTLERGDTRVVHHPDWFWHAGAPDGGRPDDTTAPVTLAPVWNGVLASRPLGADG